MSKAQWALMRGETRLEVLPVEVKGLLHWQSNPGQQLPFLLWDLSQRGVGLLISDPLQAGDSVQLTFASPFPMGLLCRVVWCEEQVPDYDFQGASYRCGLRALDMASPLPKLMEAIETLKRK